MLATSTPQRDLGSRPSTLAEPRFVTLDADGIALPSDWYLRLAGAGTRMLRGEIPLSPEIPIKPG